MFRRAFVAVAGMAITTWGVTGALGGCKSAPAPAPPDDTNQFGSSGNATSGSTASTTGGTSGAVVPPPKDSGPPDTGPPPAVSDPGKIACGTPAKVCNTPDQLCCWPNNDAGAGTCATGMCDPGIEVSFEQACDEAADCTGAGAGNVCCLDFGGTTCAQGCENGPQICKTDKECLNDAGCALRTCKLPSDQGTQTFQLRICGTTDECK